MITLSVKIGGTTITGPTFSIVDSQVDNVEVLISNLNSLSSQLVHIQMENDTEQFVEYGTSTENFGIAQTVSILLQSDNIEDISRDLATYMGIKSVIVELIP
jgi:hypothetical protein